MLQGFAVCVICVGVGWVGGGQLFTDLQQKQKARLLSQTYCPLHETNRAITEVLWLSPDNSLLCAQINGFINKTLGGYLASLAEKMRIP